MVAIMKGMGTDLCLIRMDINHRFTPFVWPLELHQAKVKAV